MKRTQLYLDDDLWETLHAQARNQKTSISHLVREAARDRYLGKLDERRSAMQALIGIRRDRSDLPDTEEYIRSLRRSTRIERLHKR